MKNSSRQYIRNLTTSSTYIEDIVKDIEKLIDKVPLGKKYWHEIKNCLSISFATDKIYNIGNNKPIQLMRSINALENALGKEAEKIYLDMQSRDVQELMMI